MADLKLDTLIKVLLMTTSDNNSESLAAIRRANVMLRNASTDWDKLLRGKVTVVADPFADIAPPPQSFSHNSKPTVPQRPQAYDDDQYFTPHAKTPTYPKTPTPPQPPRMSPLHARKNNTNAFAGHCFNCGDYTPAGYGALRDIQSKTHVFCEDCNFKVSNGTLLISTCIHNHTILQQKKQRATASSYSPRVKRKVTTKDLMADIFQDDKGPTP
jgi:hypothetical protein